MVLNEANTLLFSENRNPNFIEILGTSARASSRSNGQLIRRYDIRLYTGRLQILKINKKSVHKNMKRFCRKKEGAHKTQITIQKTVYMKTQLNNSLLNNIQLTAK